MALLWLGSMDFSLFLFLPVVINYTDIVLAQSERGLLDSLGASSNVILISAMDFNIPLQGPRVALLFCSASVCSAVLGHALVLAVGEQPV